MQQQPDAIRIGLDRTGWRFTERVAEFRYLDTTPLAGSAPRATEAPAESSAG
jgi:hypothetical protein